MASYDALLKNLPPIIGLVVLVLVLLFVLVNFGFLRACEIPGFSGLYEMFKGEPRVAIVYGDDGTGDPEAFQSLITKEAHVFPSLIRLSIVNANTLKDYRIIIVEHARTIPTEQLKFLQEHVQKGGQLVWIGDAGTNPGTDDYICEPATFTAWVASYIDMDGERQETNCAVYEKTITTSGVGDGICAKTFGKIVTRFLEENESIYEFVTTDLYHLCNAPEGDNFQVTESGRITKCIKDLKSLGKETTEDNVNQYCVYNYWNRGPSKTETGDVINPLNFAQTTLGFEFLGQKPTDEYLIITPTSANHPLTKGYGTRVQWAGNSEVTKVSTAGFTGFPRNTNTIMYMTIGGKDYPAIITSNPLGSINRNGLVVYYAFPLDEMIKSTGGTAGSTLINNLFDYLTC